MDRDELLSHANRLLDRVQDAFDEEKRHQRGSGRARHKGLKAEVGEFLRQYAGPKSSFYLQVQEVQSGSAGWDLNQLVSILESYVSFVEAGLQADVSPERRAQLDVVSDFLEQAQQLLADKRSHPAIAAFLTGATLEEFLRTWIESSNLSPGNRKPGLQNYSAVLKEAGLIDKQDVKDITAWSGLRNHAAHGEWEEVDDKRRVSLMLEGVNLFMRKYGA